MVGAVGFVPEQRTVGKMYIIRLCGDIVRVEYDRVAYLQSETYHRIV